MTPTLIVTNARIATGDPRRPWVTALAVDGTRLVALGGAAEVLKLAGASTRIINTAGGTFVLPLGTTVGSGLVVELSNLGAVTAFTRLEGEG